jgi:hypothetical protein
MEFNFLQMWDAMLTCIRHLVRVDTRYLFNAAITEPPVKFEFERSVPDKEIVAAIRAAGWRYVELYARVP